MCQLLASPPHGVSSDTHIASLDLCPSTKGTEVPVSGDKILNSCPGSVRQGSAISW